MTGDDNTPAETEFEEGSTSTTDLIQVKKQVSFQYVHFLCGIQQL